MVLSLFLAQNQCVLNNTSAFAQVLICQKINCFSCISFKENWNKYKNILERAPYPHPKQLPMMGAVCAFDQGTATSTIMRNLQDCLKICITLSSKYTCYSYPTPFFLQLSSLCWLYLLFVKISQKTNKVQKWNHYFVCIDCFLFMYAM